LNLKNTGLYRTAGLFYHTALRTLLRLCSKGSASVYCPCCGLKLKGFADGKFTAHPELYDLSHYAGIRQDIVCPGCGSLPRHRILADYFSRHSELFRGEILHFAQERCLKLFFSRSRTLFADNAAILTADLYRKADLQLDIQNTGLEDGRFSLIICNHILEHVDDYKKALRELYRICAPGGCAVISFPMLQSLETVYEDASVTDDEGRIRHFGQYDHLRIFGADSKALIEAAGFSVELISGEDAPAIILPVTGPANYDSNILFLCRKG